jgi:NTP pyrophosphatase (non-canonical NTP hydrolase)
MQLQELLDFAHLERQRLLTYFQQEGINLAQDKEILANTAKLSEEVGELSNEVLSYLGLQRKSKLAKSKPEDLAEEIADVLITTLVLADGAGIDISQALEQKIAKIKIRQSS